MSIDSNRVLDVSRVSQEKGIWTRLDYNLGHMWSS